jgi:hypothetical protein
MDASAIARLQARHDEAFERYLVAERALRIAQHLDGDATPIRLTRNELRHLAAGYAVLAANARQAL